MHCKPIYDQPTRVWNWSINSFNVESVTIPEPDIGLTTLQLDYLRQHHTLLAQSGVDVYNAVLNTVSAIVA